MSLVDSLLNFGRKRANPLATSTNSLRLTDCPCTEDPVCQDSLEITLEEGVTVTSVNFNGEDFPVGNCVESKEGKDVIIPAPIDPIADTNGFWNFLHSLVRKYEADPTKILVEVKEGTLHIIHYGACVFKSITLSNGEVKELQRACNVIRCKLYQKAVEAAEVVTINIGEVSAEFTAPEALNEAGAATLAEAINASDLVMCKDAEVTCSLDSEEYIVNIYAEEGTTPSCGKEEDGKGYPKDLEYCPSECEEVFEVAPDPCAEGDTKKVEAPSNLTNAERTELENLRTENSNMKAAIEASTTSTTKTVTSEIKISPKARELAEANSIDYTTIVGSGSGGMITKSDVQELIK